MRPDLHGLRPHERTALEAAVVALLPDARIEPGGFGLHAADGSGTRVAALALGHGGGARDVPSFRLAPCLPGSCLHRALRLRNESPDGGEEAASAIVRSGHVSSGAPSLAELEPDWYYASMTRRPTSIGGARHGAVDAGRLRVTAYVSPSPGDERRVAAAIVAVCTSLEGAFSLSIAGRTGGRERLAARLSRAHGTGARCLARDTDAPRAFFDSLAGVDLALFEDDDGRFADAIELGVPVRLLGDAVEDPRAGDEGSSRGRRDPSTSRLVAELRNVGADIARQRACLERALEPARDGTFVANDLRALHRALLALVAEAGIDVRHVAPRAFSPVIPRLPRGVPPAARGRLRLDGPRRKLAKLRESPVRFFRDARPPRPWRRTGRR